MEVIGEGSGSGRRAGGGGGELKAGELARTAVCAASSSSFFCASSSSDLKLSSFSFVRSWPSCVLFRSLKERRTFSCVRWGGKGRGKAETYRSSTRSTSFRRRHGSMRMRVMMKRRTLREVMAREPYVERERI